MQDHACPEKEPVTVKDQAASSLIPSATTSTDGGSRDYLPFPDKEAEVPRDYQSQSPCSELATCDRERNCSVARPAETVCVWLRAGAEDCSASVCSSHLCVFLHL